MEKIFISNPFGGLEQLIKSWDDYPLDQWIREQEIGRVQQANFKPPEFDNNTDQLTKEICGGRWIKILTDDGWHYVCEKCKSIMPVASHKVFYTNDEWIALLV